MTHDITEYIQNRKLELNAVILAHYYQQAEIQDIADFVGDSLQLARQAAETDADVIICCGVKFMAETAKILNPDKKVILPDINAGCPMADMVRGKELREKKRLYPNAVVVCYVNSSAEVKAESDICCTSSNALNVIRSIPPERDILFVPDRNLGAYVASQTGRKIILWEGYCPVHEILDIRQLQEQIDEHPGAEVIVHPECRPEIIQMADAVRSTAGLLQYVISSKSREFIVGTEEGFLHTLKKHCPEKKYYLARSNFICRDMKQLDLNRLAAAMDRLETQVEVDPEVMAPARLTLEKMMAI